MFHFQFSLSLSKKSHLGSSLFCLKIVCMTLSCRQLRLLLSSPIFLTPCLFAAKSTFPFCICVAFVFLPRICIFGWTVAGLAGRPIFVFALGAGGVLCCHWTHSHSQRAAFVLPNNRRVTKHKAQIYTYKSFQIYCTDANINYTNIQICLYKK